MPKMDWKGLSAESRQKLGAYGEYFAKMEFASYGFDVFTSEVDDHGIDFVCLKKNRLFKIQVKSVQTSTNYVFMKEKHFDITDGNLYVCLLIFEQNHLPELYLIPAGEWKSENTLLKHMRYDKPGQKSEPEYGINLSNNSRGLLQKYRIDKMLDGLQAD